VRPDLLLTGVFEHLHEMVHPCLRHAVSYDCPSLDNIEDLVERSASCLNEMIERHKLTARESISFEDLWFKPRNMTILPIAAAIRPSTLNLSFLRVSMILSAEVLVSRIDNTSRRRTRLTSTSLFEKMMRSWRVYVFTIADGGILCQTLESSGQQNAIDQCGNVNTYRCSYVPL
jgi:hypothetical protein